MLNKKDIDEHAAESLNADLSNLGNIVNKVAMEEEVIKIDFEFPQSLKKIVDDNGENYVAMYKKCDSEEMKNYNIKWRDSLVQLSHIMKMPKFTTIFQE